MMNGNIPSFLLDAVSDDGIPDFQVGTDATQIFITFFVGMAVGILVHKLLLWIIKKCEKWLNEEKKKENGHDNETKN